MNHREQVLSDYDVDQYGVIRSPGKFEGEKIYIPYLWDKCLEGMSDLDLDGVFGIEITKADIDEFPELTELWNKEQRPCIALEESESGFVYSAEWKNIDALERHLEGVFGIEITTDDEE